MRRLVLAFVLLWLGSFAEGASVKFHSINAVAGISMRVMNSICEDDQGFIWASSKTGILRLTHEDYRVYELPYETAGVLIVKLLYANSLLTAYTNNGQVFTYNPVFDRFDLLVNLSKALNHSYFDLYSLHADDQGTYWIALSSGLYTYRAGTLTLVESVSGHKYAITPFDDQHMLMASAQGIRLIDIPSLKGEFIYRARGLESLAVSSLYFDRKRNQLWMGTMSSGLYGYDFRSSTLQPLLRSSFPHQPILAIEESTDSTLLVGVDGQGLWEVSADGRKVWNVYKESADDPYSLRGNGVYDIYRDRNNRIWICTISGGVSFFDQGTPLVQQVVHRADEPNSLVNNDVNSILEDSNGNLWFATNNGISCWDVAADRWRSFYSNELEQAQVFLALCQDNRGRIWAGSYSSGVYVLDAKTGRELAHYSRNHSGFAPASDFVFDIFKDSEGDLWIGGVNGAFVCYLAKEDRFRSYAVEPISSFAELSPGRILLGCSYGVSLLNKESGVIRQLLSGIAVQDIQVLDGEIWICTSGDGLLKYNPADRSTTRFTTRSGLPSNFINSVVYAGSYLWLGTENGLCRFHPKDHAVLTFSSAFPLSGLSFNKCAQFVLQDGRLGWGTNGGALFFRPESLRESPPAGKIFLQDITVSGRSIRDTSLFLLDTPIDSLRSLQLNYFQNTLSLELVPLGVSSGSKFSWMLEGFDKEWSSPSGSRIVTYTNIPSGDYVLKIKLLDSSLSHVLSERLLAVRLVPPFWLKGWFWTLAGGLVTGIVLLSMLFYINRLKQKHSEEKVRFFHHTAHEIRTALTLIKAPIEELWNESGFSEKGKYYLRLAMEQSEQLSMVVTRLMDFQKADTGKEQMAWSMVDVVALVAWRKRMFESVARNRNVDLLFSANCSSFFSVIDEPKMVKVIDNLLANAIQYSFAGGSVQVELSCTDTQWVLQVKDRGMGISEAAQRRLFKEFYRAENAVNSKVAGSGLGLLLVKNYVTMHRGRVECQSRENEGSIFRIVVPFKTLATQAPVGSPLFDSGGVSSLPYGSEGMADANGASQPAKRMQLLIVEDNEALLQFMRSALEEEFLVETAIDGARGWEIVLKQMPDLVVSDIMMPKMDGFALCRLMKSTYETSHIPMVLLTALSEKAKQLEGLGLGADDYLTKPFDLALLRERIRSIIRNRAIVREKGLKMLDGGNDNPLFANALNDQFVKKMFEVARANMENPAFNKEAFASAMLVSSSLLYKKVKAFTGLSPTDFIKTVRLDHAMELLRQKRYTVTEVSEMCGFASVGYFSTVFRKHFGKPPSEAGS